MDGPPVIRVPAILVLLSLPFLQGQTPGVHLQGSQKIWNRGAADLDNYVVQVDNGNDDPYLYPPDSFDGSDFWYEVEHKTERLHPQHGARLAVGGTDESGFLGCSGAVYLKGAIRISDSPVGLHICVRTNEGRYSEIRIDAIDQKNKTISFSFTTWKKNEADTTYQPR
jgi:hypothetical protein